MGSVVGNPNLGLGDCQQRITPTPVFVGQSQAEKMDGNTDQRLAPVMYKSLEEIEKGISELIQRCENEKKVQEDLEKFYKEKNPFSA